MCKECEGCKEFKEYKMPYIANGDRLYYNSFEELTDDLKDKFKSREQSNRTKKAYIGFINKLNENGDKLVSDYVNNNTIKVRIHYGKCSHTHPEGEGVIPNDYKNKRGCGICRGRIVVKGINDLTTTHPELAKEWHPTKNGDLKPAQVSFGTHKKVWWQCEHGHEWEALVYSRAGNDSNCPYCANQKVLKGYNDIATTHPQYVKYFVNIEDAYTHTYCSGDEVEMKCPICGAIKVMHIYTLVRQGFGCSKCGDGISYPEKVLTLLLDYLNIKFKKQLKFDGYKFLYDFYLIDYDIIIEVHGGQHYNLHRQSNWRSYKEEHENDLIKYDIAVLNGYEYNKNYFVIDARESNIEWLINSINNCLFFQQFDLNSIDWKEFDKQAQKSRKVEACLYWKEQKEVDKDLTTIIMAEIFNVDRHSIKNWLAWGNENGLCKYNGKEESKAKERRQSKFAYLIKPDGTKWYNEAMSQGELSRLTGISFSTISLRKRDWKPLDGHRANYDSKYIGSYIIEEDKLEEFLLNLKGGDIIE